MASPAAGATGAAYKKNANNNTFKYIYVKNNKNKYTKKCNINSLYGEKQWTKLFDKRKNSKYNKNKQKNK